MLPYLKYLICIKIHAHNVFMLMLLITYVYYVT